MQALHYLIGLQGIAYVCKEMSWPKLLRYKTVLIFENRSHTKQITTNKKVLLDGS